MPPFRHPEVFLSMALPSIPFKSSAAAKRSRWAGGSLSFLLGTRGQVAGRAGSPRRESPQIRHQSALPTDLGPYRQPVLDLVPWEGDVSGYQKVGSSTHEGECKPLDHLPIPSKGKVAQDGSSFCGCLGKCVFS